MSTITDPKIFAGRLSRDCMHGWIAFSAGPHQDDVAVKLGRYPVTHTGGGKMRVVVDMPADFKTMDCQRVALFSRKGRMLHDFKLEATVTYEAKSILWIP